MKLITHIYLGLLLICGYTPPRPIHLHIVLLKHARHIYAFLNFFFSFENLQLKKLGGTTDPLLWIVQTAFMFLLLLTLMSKVPSLGGVGVLATAAEVPVTFINKIMVRPVCTAYIKVARYRNTKCHQSVIESVSMCNHISPRSHSDMLS